MSLSFLKVFSTMSEILSPKDRLEQNVAHCRLVFSRLKEQDKRHVAGLLALLVGHGGVSWVAESVGMARDCVSRGQAEVENGLEGRPTDRQRLPGGGRKPLSKKVPK
jgi:DNA-binding phage protein